jgi:hypothetical protein
MSDILRRARLVNREIFDPTNKKHVESFKIFLATNSWGDIQFYPETPYTEAPATVMSKFARHALKVQIMSDADRAVALAARGVIIDPVTETPDQKAERIASANALLKIQLEALGGAR